MNASTFALQATALCLSLLWLGLALAARPRSPLNIVWALFCGSIAMSTARDLIGPEAGTWSVLLGAGACFTCNGFWLVARGLFRDGRPFLAPHVAYVGLVAVLIVLSQRNIGAPAGPVLDEVLRLLSSTTLVLAFWEGVRGWSAQRGAERAVRIVFLAVYGSCVGLALLLPIVLGSPAGTGAGALGAAAAATTIMFVTQALVTWRLRHPLQHADQAGAAPQVTLQADAPARLGRVVLPSIPGTGQALIRDEDAALAQVLEGYMRAQQPFLQSELKLSHLAQALDVSEYRISRAVHDVLGHANISQYVNAFRLGHAQALLADPLCDDWSTLVIGLESGFGSLGAFHRAFKAAMGCPPGEYRATRRASDVPTAACAALSRS